MIKILLFLGLSMALTENQKLRSEKIDAIFNTLTKDNLDVVYEFYAQDIEFHDPIGSLKGIEAMKSYYAGMYKNVTSIRFDFTNEVVQDNSHVVMWDMYLKSSGLNGGEEVVVTGNSHIVFNDDNKAIYHRDYFDMGSMIYEYIPVLGRVIKYIRSMFEHK